MSFRTIISVSCIIFICLIILPFKTAVNGQTFPWSWPPANPFPVYNQIPISIWPQPSYFPTAGLFTTSGWPAYSPPPSYTPAPGGVPTSSTGCPVGLVTGLTLDEEFGPGASQITRCLVLRTNIKVVMQINQFESRPGRPYGLTNISRMINDYEITNGTRDYKIVAINHGSGAIQLLNRNAAQPHLDAKLNIYQELVEELIVKGVKFYLCMNSARSDGIKAFHLIPGVQFVTTAPTAIIDFQKLDYKYIQP